MKHFLLLLVAGMLSYPMLSYCCDMPPTTSVATPVEIRAYFKGQGKSVLTFVGYSAAEYENKPAMMEEAGRVLDNFDPVKTIVNSGATREGIGAVYELAKRKGFATTGIVSVKAREDSTPMSPCVDIVFFVEDETWGGRLPGTDALSPTSSAMVDNSDVMVAIGGGDVAKEEMVAARRAGKTTRFIPADMNHRIAREKAATQGRPPPTDFSSVVGSAL